MSGCGGGGHPGGGYPGHGGGAYNTNVNVNVSANANASAYAGSYAGAAINARGYDVGAIRGGGGYGGAIVLGSGYGGWDSLGYGGGAGAVVVRGPGYGPSRPFGYVVSGFGRRYVTTDRCGSCGAPPPPPPPPPSCRSRCDGGYSDGHAYDYEDRRGDRYSDRHDHEASRDCGCDGPRYVAQPYYAAPLEPVDLGYQAGYDHRSYESREYRSESHGSAYASGYDVAPVHADPAQMYVERPDARVRLSQVIVEPPQVHVSDCADGTACAPVTTDDPYATPYEQAPADYYGDLPPGDDGVSMPYRQEPGERG